MHDTLQWCSIMTGFIFKSYEHISHRHNWYYAVVGVNSKGIFILLYLVSGHITHFIYYLRVLVNDKVFGHI